MNLDKLYDFESILFVKGNEKQILNLLNICEAEKNYITSTIEAQAMKGYRPIFYA